MQLFRKAAQEKGRSRLDSVEQGNTQFALDLYRKLRGTEGNLFFSPYSISAALAMTYAGARGDTQTQMAQALHFPPDQDQLHPAFTWLGKKLGEAGGKGHIQLKVANALWPQKGYTLLKEFLGLLKKFYGVPVTQIDFADEEAARRTINDWVSDKTESRIKDLIPPGVLDRLTRLVLANAIYFKGDWATPFDPGRTSQAPFYPGTGGQVTVPMMTVKHTFRYAENRALQVLELLYAGEDLSMTVLLPAQPDGLAELEGSLAVENLDKWSADLVDTEVEVSLPRFEIAFPFRLDDSLKSLGMLDAFSNQADFSGMDGSRELYIGAALHKAFVAVNEQGTEAAAASAVVMQLKALSFPAVVFRADHPFLFLIREKAAGSILFIGRVKNPA